MRNGQLARLENEPASLDHGLERYTRTPQPATGAPARAKGRRKDRPVAIIKIARFWPGGRKGDLEAAPVGEPDGLDAFGSEDIPASPRPQLHVVGLPAASPVSVRRSWRPLKIALLVAVSVGAGGAGMWGYQRYIGARAAQPLASAEIAPPPAPVAAAVAAGSLRIQTEPAGLTVLVDDIERGASPLTIPSLSPGEHLVVVAAEGTTVRQTVSVRANETVSLVVSAVLPPRASTAGWLVVSSPLVLQMRENGKIIGSTDMDRVMLASGDHTVEFVNEALGYRVQRKVSVAPGAPVRIALSAPEGAININAQPWADVWLDGRHLGETPIGRAAVPIGSHEVLFRHPELGERRATVIVGLKETARVGVDLRKR